MRAGALQETPFYEPDLGKLPHLLSVGDLDAAGACFARDACLVTPGATAVHGREPIRSLLAQLIARGVKVFVENSTSLRAGPVLFANQRWRLTVPGPDQVAAIEQVTDAVLILRHLEGSWKLAIVAPWGLAATPLQVRRLERLL